MIHLSNSIKAALCLAGGFLIHLSLGTIYTFGNMSPYIASYLKYKTNDNWVTNGHMVWVFAITIVFIGLLMPFGGLMEKKCGARITCLVGGWLMSLGTIATYFTIKINIWCVIITYGFAFGAGSGLCYSVAIAVTMKWYPTRRGVVAGTVAAGYGLGTLIFNPIQTKYINPSNISPNITSTAEKYFTNEIVIDNIPFCFVIIGSAYAIIQLIGVILLMDPDCQESSKKETDDSDLHFQEQLTHFHNLISEESEKISENELLNEENHEESKTKIINPNEYSLKRAIKNKKLWILFMTFHLNGIFILTLASLYKSFGQTFINNDTYFSIVGAIASIFNAAGRPVWGRLLDIITYKKMMTSLTICMTLTMGSFYLNSLIKGLLLSQVLFGINVCLLFLCLAGSFAMFPTITSQCFGSSNLAIIYGVVFIGYSFSGIVGALFCSLLLPRIYYGGVFLLASVTSMISLVLTQFFPENVNKQKQVKEQTNKEANNSQTSDEKI